METKLNTPNFSRGKMINKDWDDLLAFKNEESKKDFKKNRSKKKWLRVYTRVEPFLYKEKQHRTQNGIHEKISYKEPVTIILVSDPHMDRVHETHVQAIEHQKRNGGSGYIQKIFGLFISDNEGEHYEHIGNVVVGVHPNNIEMIHTPKEERIREESLLQEH